MTYREAVWDERRKWKIRLAKEISLALTFSIVTGFLIQLMYGQMLEGWTAAMLGFSTYAVGYVIAYFVFKPRKT